MLYTDLQELKAVLEIDPENTAEDAKLLLCVRWASQWIEEILDRPGMSYSERTEYYQGYGTPNLILKSRPVYTTPAIRVWSDQGGGYGQPTDAFSSATELTYGTDFVLKVDQDNGTSRSGILQRINGVWSRSFARQAGWLTPFIVNGMGTIKVTYTAGYTINTLPAPIRMATDFLIARLRYVLPLGMELLSESYEDRSISIAADRKEYLITMIKPMIWNYRNWHF